MKTIYINKFISQLKKNDLVYAIRNGAYKHDYDIKLVPFSQNFFKNIDESDILVTWNRHLNQNTIAKEFEKIGAQVWTFENPYIELNDENKWYSIGLGYHNNINHAIDIDDHERWAELFSHIELKDWKKRPNSLSDIVVATQNKSYNESGIGFDGYDMPAGWDEKTLNYLRYKSQRNIIYRQSPKTKQHNLSLNYDNVYVSNGARRSLEQDLMNAYCLYTHTSNCTTQALISGIPVVYTGPHIFLEQCCSRDIDNLNFPENRQKNLDKMAWNQYNIKEIQSGFLQEILLCRG